MSCVCGIRRTQQQEHDQEDRTHGDDGRVRGQGSRRRSSSPITDEMVQHYIKGLDEPNPWYTAASPFGGPVAPVIVYQQADSRVQGLVPRQPLRQPVAASGMGDLRADARGTGPALQRAGGRSLPAARSRRRRAGDVGARRGRAADRAQRPSPELPGRADQRRGRPARSGEQGRRAGRRRALRGAAVGRAPQDVHRRDVRRVLLPQPELSQRQGRLEGARLRGHGDRRPHDALVRHRAPDPAFRPRLLPGRAAWT